MEIIAELGLYHEGSVGRACALIDACTHAGVDAVKFQCHAGDRTADFREGTFHPQDATRADYYQRTGFTQEQWAYLKGHCLGAGVEFIVTPFSLEAVEYMGDLPDRWKIGSGQTHDLELIRAVGAKGKPIIISTGMSDWEEMRQAKIEAYQAVRPAEDVTVLECVSMYPCPPELCQMPGGLSTGLSDHSGEIWPGIIAAWEGADMLEVHVCFDRRDFGFDVPASLTVDDLEELIEGVQFVEKMRAGQRDKDAMANTPEMQKMREIFRGAKA